MKYKVVKSKILSKPYDPRFVVIDEVTGKILDDAQGYGYRSVQKAHAAYAYKNRSAQKKARDKAMERSVRKWTKEHPELCNLLKGLMLDCLKDHEKINGKFIEEFFKEQKITAVPFSGREFLKYWN